jgi:hypothetical protein
MTLLKIIVLGLRAGGGTIHLKQMQDQEALPSAFSVLVRD